MDAVADDRVPPEELEPRLIQRDLHFEVVAEHVLKVHLVLDREDRRGVAQAGQRRRFCHGSALTAP
ncbi:hypothetical protein [Catenulispora pinisilvae]|uniref:hypothetical protein n=1 Tax=Catenulispora pinisilvae TaxID=2705253 RepID=UPI0018917194|nr:hypothetical protein [Catenulispora pinisilvae]